MSHRLLTASIISLLCSAWAWSQASERILSISGEVFFEDGTRPKQPVLVELLCTGITRRQTYTQQGFFSLEFGRPTPIEVRDAGMEGMIRRREFSQGRRDSLDGRVIRAYSEKVQNNLDLAGCELRAVLEGFQSDTIPLSRRRALDNPYVGEIILRHRSKTKGTFVSLNTARASEKARKAYHKGQKELVGKKTDYPKAAQEFGKAVQEFPEFSAAWYLLGKVHLNLQDERRAQEAFERAIAVEPEFIQPYLALAQIQFSKNRWKEVNTLSRKVIELNPDTIQAHYLCSVANYSLGQLDSAEKSARTVVDSPKALEFPQARFILGGILSQKNLIAAAVEFNRFLDLESEGPVADRAKQILIDWERRGLIGKPQSDAAAEN